MGPHTDPEKSKILGVASHICAAQPGGPRYDPSQTSTQRSSIRNAIWLCEICGKEIDKDDSPFPKELLLEWKAAHEKYIATLGSMGFREAFLSTPPAQSDTAVARRVIQFFGDRRVLHSFYEYETPNYILQSVQRIRDELWNWSADLSDDSELRELLTHVREACLSFLDDVGHIDSTTRIGSQLPRWEKLLSRLSGFRKAVGTSVGEISDKYKIVLSAELLRMVPGNDASSMSVDP